MKIYYQFNGTWYFTPIDNNINYLVFIIYLAISAILSILVLLNWVQSAENGRNKYLAKLNFFALIVFFILTFFTNLIFPLSRQNIIPALAPVNALFLSGSGMYTLWMFSKQSISRLTMHNLVMRYMREFLFILNRDKKPVGTNLYTLANLKYNQYELLNDDLSFVFTHYEIVEFLLENEKEQYDSDKLLVELITRNNQKIPVNVSVIHIKDSYEKVRAYVIACVDYSQRLQLKEEISERARTEKNLYKIRKELEMLVQKRTNELNEANQKLQQEVIERKRAELQTQADLDEKIELVKEVHHRVKNNIQMIISLINMLCSHPVIDEKSSNTLRETAEKVRYISHIHEDFYSSPNLSRIDFSGYLKKAVGELYSNYGRGTDITFKLNLSDQFLEINQAIPLGIIFNELLMNAMLFAFKYHAKDLKKPDRNIVNIEFYKDRQKVILIIKDNGIGLPVEYKELKSGKIGFQLVDILTRDHLKGEVDCMINYGTSFKVSFEV